MKKIFLFTFLIMFTFSCNQMVEKPKTNINPEYSKNLKTAQTFFELFFISLLLFKSILFSSLERRSSKIKKEVGKYVIILLIKITIPSCSYVFISFFYYISSMSMCKVCWPNKSQTFFRFYF